MISIKNPIDPTLFDKFSRRSKPQICYSDVVGFDVETQDGYAKIGASSFGWQEINDIEDVYRFLCNRKFRKTRNFFFNMKFDFETMFKYDLDILRQLSKGNTAKTEKYDIFYIPNKLLKISDHHRHTYMFFDIFQFYLTSLEVASKKYLNKETSDVKQNREFLFDLYTSEEIGEYCLSDAVLTKELAEKFIVGLNHMSLYPKKLISCGNISEQYVLKNADVPKFKDVPRVVQNMFWLSYRGGWFDTWRKGYFANAWQYDIKSAYPSVMLNLLDVRKGKWANYLDLKQKLGVVKVSLSKGDDSFLSIKSSRQTVSPSIYPEIDMETTIYLTLSEYKEFKKIYDHEVITAFTFIPEELHYPYRPVVRDLYDYKEGARGDPAKYLVSKQIFNSFYGKTCQKRKEGDVYVVGSLFNPVYASEITAGCRLQMWKAIKRHRKDVVSIMTDGIIFSRDVKLKTGEELGDWSIEQENEDCLVVKTGIYQFGDTKPKRRGLVRMGNLKEALKRSDKPYISINYTRPRHFKEMLIQKTAENIGVFLPDTKKVNVCSDVKRLWQTNPARASDLLDNQYESIPLPISALSF